MHERRARGVALLYSAALQDRNPHRLEIAAADGTHFGAAETAAAVVIALDLRGEISLAGQGGDRHHCSGTDTGKGLDSIEQLPVKTPNARDGERLHLRTGRGHCNYVRRVEAELFAAEIVESLGEQRRADEQCERKRHFAYYQYIADAAVSRAALALPGSFLQCIH